MAFFYRTVAKNRTQEEKHIDIEQIAWKTYDFNEYEDCEEIALKSEAFTREQIVRMENNTIRSLFINMQWLKI